MESDPVPIETIVIGRTRASGLSPILANPSSLKGFSRQIDVVRAWEHEQTARLRCRDFPATHITLVYYLANRFAVHVCSSEDN